MRVVETTRDLERSSEHGQFPVVIPAGTLGWITQQGDGTSLQAPIRLGEATVLVRVPDPPEDALRPVANPPEPRPWVQPWQGWFMSIGRCFVPGRPARD